MSRLRPGDGKEDAVVQKSSVRGGGRERVEGGWFRSVRLVFAARTQRARGQ